MSVNRNTAANLAGRLWAAGLGIVLIPIYVNVLGMESYALVGIFGVLLGIFGLLDFGFGAAFSREVARVSAVDGTEQQQRDLLVTFSLIYWTAAVVVAVSLALVAPIIATKWVRAETLSVPALVMSIRLMGIAVALQFPMVLYQGCLLGLQRHVEYNAILVSAATVRGAGALMVLWFISPTVQAFFLWQALLTLLAVGAHWLVLNRVLVRAPRRAAFRFALMAGVSTYAAGSMANSIGIVVAQQSDKIILSKTLPLEQLGYYTLAGAVASLLWTLISSVTSAAFPRFNQCVAVDDEAGLSEAYDGATQLMATVVLPTSMVLMFFSREVMTLWTRKPAIAAATGEMVVLFSLGMTLAGFVNLALHVALSHSWFRLTIGFTWGVALAAAPLFWIASRFWGSRGAAAVWMLQYAALLLLVPLLHRRYLRGQAGKWLKQAVVFPAAVSGLTCAVARWVAPTVENPAAVVAMLGLTWAIATIGVVLVEPIIRAQFADVWTRMKAVPDGA
jgi:O-antigen/teichoic acid export membrane protein